MRHTGAAIVAAALIALTLAGEATGAGTDLEREGTATMQTQNRIPRWWREECRFQLLNDQPGYQFGEVVRTVRCAAWRWLKGRIGTLRCIIEHESGYNPTADNPHSTAAGVFQIVAGTWEAWRFGNPVFARRAAELRLSGSVYDARANVLIGTWAVGDVGVGPWAGSGCG